MKPWERQPRHVKGQLGGYETQRSQTNLDSSSQKPHPHQPEKLLDDMSAEVGALTRVLRAGRETFLAETDAAGDWQRIAQFCVQRIQEAAERMPESFRDKHSEIDWKGLHGMRVTIPHRCDEVDPRRLWEGAEYLVNTFAPKLGLANRV